MLSAEGEIRTSGTVTRLVKLQVFASHLSEVVLPHKAEETGFEPAWGVNPNSLSKRAPSTAQPLFRFVY